MQKRGTIVWLLAAAAFWWLAGRLHEPLIAARREPLPEPARRALEQASPLVAFTTVALGGFQGLIADLLWLRASRLQDEGEYFEIVQLADWITKLEPRYAEVWAFHAWNMAYNISVMFPDPEDRWRWVRHGIRLLRDEGLRHNPADPLIYRELGWLYQHKIGQHWDDAHLYYKWRLALEMADLFDNGRPDVERLAHDAELRRRLREGPGLDADAVTEVEGLYGPLDWRAPDTLAVYWAWRGARVASAGAELPAVRMILQGLAQSLRQGRIVLDPGREMLLTSPNLDIFPSARHAFSEALERFDRNETIRAGYFNFLRDAVILFYVYGRRAEAGTAHAEIRTAFPEENIEASLENFALQSIVSEMQEVSLRHAAAMIEGFFFQGVTYRLLGENARAAALEELAGFIHGRAAARFGGREATAMPPVEWFRRRALERARALPGLSDGTPAPARGPAGGPGETP